MSNRHALHQAKRRDRLRNAKRHDISRNARRHRSITRAPTQSGSQRKAGPAAQTELRDPLLYSRCNNREAPLHALPSACSLRQTEASTISPAVRHLGAQDYPFRRKRTIHFAQAGFVCGQESFILSTCGQNERFLPAYTLRGGPFQRFFAHGEPFLPKTALLWAISRKESFILSRGDQNERFFAVHERKRPLQPR